MMVARREQGAVGNVSRREWRNSKKKNRHHKLKNSCKKWWKMEKSSYYAHNLSSFGHRHPDPCTGPSTTSTLRHLIIIDRVT